ncbi:hypothetical protein GIB67_027672 [Kingdonia uniflora]|uniref:Transposase MuDR plant domain-containing protein n=1 Tax=Kingdonia uniflora TaxID=39325 RepID=A0A7J7NLN5_9MAGN|nr:hypothetical protein GIB67_027672 [Kingdonia uniflora]
MNGVQLYTIIHFGGDIVCPKIRSIVSYVRVSTKLTSLRAHSSYEDSITLLKETNEIRCKDWLFTTKDIGSGRGLSTTKAGGHLRHNSFLDPKLEYRGYPETNGKWLDPRRFGPLVDNDDVPQSNESFKTISEFRFKPQPEQVKDLLDFWFKSAAYTEDPYDFSKEFNICDLYRDKIELKNHIRTYAVVNKFNLKHVLSNEYKIMVRCKGHKCFGKIYATRYGVAYTNHVESWNNVILKVRDLPIHVFIEELCRICSEMSYTYREEAEKSQARFTPWVTDHCETDPHVRAPIPTVRAGRPRTQRKKRGKMPGLVTKLIFCSKCQKNGHNRRSCKLLPILSDENTRPTMAPSFTMSTEPPIIPDEDVAISLY